MNIENNSSVAKAIVDKQNSPDSMAERRINHGALEFIVAPDFEVMSKIAAEAMYRDILAKPNMLFCAATGATPTVAYDLLAEKYSDNPRAFADLRVLKLDEWGGIPMDDAATCEVFLNEHLNNPLHINKERFISWQSDPADPQAEVERIQGELKKRGQIDLCILGMGVNGHLGFNEPAKALHPFAHVAALTETTKKHTMAQRATHKIGYGLTLGLADIMNSKKIILLVNGEAKKEPMKRFLSGDITAEFPASMLWMHPNVTVICDEAAYG